MTIDIDLAHKQSIRHRGEIEASGIRGCFYCLETYSPTEITEWTDEGQTALCPRCGIDSVLGDASGVPITSDFLTRMSRHWF
ncbi:cytoplasmic protein [Pseudaminobacter soli (ex Li et al. 2025)]|uniref:Cytoplasmic protein n=1 Tax=Pseudaminobacter soli (ex Li et al. 2025) TaxID=1295366 RepID=A0A2P7SBC8_9HYPH|nr:cytoplasmic protein [Mesorhizobium soli]PSJ59651.1 cytoplasmic protein [Mesorhizobium soli]